MTAPLPPSPIPAPETTVFRGSVLKVGPPWLEGPFGARLLYSTIGIIYDCLAEYLRIGKLQGFPGKAQPEALRYLGADRKIIRGFRESDTGYADRIIGAFPTWKFAGNAPTLLRQLAAYFAPTPPVIRYVVNGEFAGQPFADWWTIQDGALSYHHQSPNNWNWDGQTGQIRFWIIVYRNEGFTPWFWGDGHYWGGGQSWGFEENFTENFAYDARNLINQWKAAGSHAWRFGGIIVTGDMSLFDPTGFGAGYPDGTWSTYANRAGIPTTFYLDGI
jgi:hypothetical protein